MAIVNLQEDKYDVNFSEDVLDVQITELISLGSQGLGDMRKVTYDPDLIYGDIFDMDNMKEGANTKILTDNERDLLDVLKNVLPGVIENKDHISKIDETHISISAGSAKIRKDDDTLHYVSWDAIESYEVNIGLNLPWVTFKWNIDETDIELDLITYLPKTLKEVEKVAIIGRLWIARDGILSVSGRHTLLSNDIYISRSEAWRRPSRNIDIIASTSELNINYMKLSSGELLRWPVCNIITGSHIFEYSGNSKIDYIWSHSQGQSTHDVIEDNGTNDEFDIKTIADYYDNNGVQTLILPNKFSAHVIGAYSKSEILVWWRGQYIYDTMEDAKAAIHSDIFIESQWLQDRQISKIAWVVMKSGSRDFTNKLDVAFIDYF